MRLLAIALGLSVAFAGINPAMAHPHVFIDNRVTLNFENGALAGFRTEWRFDDIFTADLLAQYDLDGDGQFSAAESKAVGEGTLPNLKGFHYFTYAYAGGQDLGVLEPSAFQSDIVDGVARFALTFRFAAPIDARQSKTEISVYDQEYYVEVALAQSNPVSIEGDVSGTCKASVRDDPAHAYFGGFVIPQLIEVTCP